jgi:mannose-6-phosphate isomerase
MPPARFLMHKNLPLMFLLDNPVRHYAWGSYDGLSIYAGMAQDKDRPSAECWMGAHPDDPSLLRLPDGGKLGLDKYIAEQPVRSLGDEVFSEFGGLPFLFKVLSASMPLSIQVHPDKAEAEAGFAREEARGVGMSQPERDYRDRNHKPELALALSEFSALCGFREAGEIEELLGPELVAYFAFSAGQGESSLRSLITKALSIREKERLALERLALARGRALQSSDDASVRLAGKTLLSCYAHYPHDPGALSPLFLRVLNLHPGQAIYVPAGVMHAYLSGTILEIMASSDNVIRGGLTQKHIDVGELLNIMDFSAAPSLIEAKPEPLAGSRSWVWESPAKEFELSRIDLSGGLPVALSAAGPEILLCTEGEGMVACRDFKRVEAGSGQSHGFPSAECRLARGDSAFISAACGHYSLSGSGKVYRARSGLGIKEEP